MRKKIRNKFILFIFLVVFLSTLAGGVVLAQGSEGGVVSHSLREEIEKKEKGTAEVVIRLAPSDGREVIRAREEKGREGAVEALKTSAKNKQEGIQNAFERGEIEGEIINSFWITNAVLAEVKVQDVEKIAQRDEVERIHKNFQINIPAPLKGSFVVHSDAMQSDDEFTWGLERIGVPEVWDMGFKGSSDIKVAVLDTGVDIEHDDLEGKMYTEDEEDDTYPGGWVEFDEEGNAKDDSEPHDTHGHGTHVSGTVVGGDAGGTHIGVAPETKLMHGLVLPDGEATFAQIIAGMEWAMDDEDPWGNDKEMADVVNMSFGVDEYQGYFEEPLEKMINTGIVPVGAMGNDGEGKYGSPGAIYETLAIGASDEEDKIADFSSGGVVDDSRDDTPLEYVKPNFSAPGVGVKSAVPGNNYSEMDGTSMAAPHVAGAIALLLDFDPDLTVDNIYDLLKNNISYYDEVGDFLDDGEDKNTRYGYGIIDIHQAVLSLEAEQLSFKKHPTTSMAGKFIGDPAIEVEIQDQEGNLVGDATNEVKIWVENDPTTGNAELSGTLTQEAQDGIATFDDLWIDKAETGYTLEAISEGLESAVSDQFDIEAGDAGGKKTTITADPLEITADGASTSTITVQAQDEFGNELEEGGDEVTLKTDKGSLSAVTDHNDGTYSATLTSATERGTATVTGKIDQESIEDEVTVDFVAGNPDQLFFVQHPTDTTAGEVMTPAIEVEIQDQEGNLVGDATNEVKIWVENDPTTA